jgi:hypothetical protein
MTSNHNYDYFNEGCHGMAANGLQLNAVGDLKHKIINLK